MTASGYMFVVIVVCNSAQAEGNYPATTRSKLSTIVTIEGRIGLGTLPFLDVRDVTPSTITIMKYPIEREIPLRIGLIE